MFTWAPSFIKLHRRRVIVLCVLAVVVASAGVYIIWANSHPKKTTQIKPPAALPKKAPAPQINDYKVKFDD